MKLEGLQQLVMGKTVLVTGAGGTVGGEVVRQLIKLCPGQIICLGRNKDKLSNLFVTSKTKCETEVVWETCDICDRDQVNVIFYKYDPDIVFHLAAEKDIKLTNADPFNCVMVNVIGTFNIVQSAKETNADNLLFTSSIKANYPTSIMGATKRIGEFLVKSAAIEIEKSYYTVRLSNVMESEGGVYSLFCNQIANGGPITITHPDAVRVFVSAKETACLLLYSLMCAHPGSVLGLTAGNRMKIVDLAIRLIGEYEVEEGREIEISYVGLRNGEKLVEEDVGLGAEWLSTTHDKILVSNQIFDLSVLNNVEDSVTDLMDIVRKKDLDGLQSVVRTIVPGYGR